MTPDEISFELLKTHLIRWTGLAYYETRDDDLAGIIGRRLDALGISGYQVYLDLLREESARGVAERDALLAHLTIGETYFFRDGGQFEALSSLVLPGLLFKKRSERRLRIWSAGCATGTEPYSVAILIARALAHEGEGWDIRIWGTDINQMFLDQAIAGRFTAWDLRATPPEVRQNCFRETAQHWEICPAYTKWTVFDQHNLIKDRFPHDEFDLILCRNVAIYFSEACLGELVGKFSASLKDGGWLLTGHSELWGNTHASLRQVNANGATLYRKAATAAPAAPARANTPQPSPGLVEMRKAADRGDWARAACCGGALVDKERLNPLGYFYYALVMQQLGVNAEAERLLRQAIFLDARFVLAHYHLGLALRESPRQARQSFETTRMLLSIMGDQDTFAEADGMTAAQLGEAVQIQLQALLNVHGAEV